MRSAANLPISPTTIVRHGFTRRERLAIARRDPRAMAALDSYSATIINEICALCDAFAVKHGTHAERFR